MIRRILLLTFVAALFTTAALAQSCLPGASWCSGAYSYDGAGNIRAIGNDVYIYDTAGRLVSGTADVQRTGVMSRQDYSYDAFGNRIAASRVANSVNCSGACDLPVTIDPNTNHINNSGAQYDAAGNLTFIQNTVGSTTYSATYSYDTAGRLARATANSDDRQFLYTADDERIATANGASWTWTIRGLDGKVLREFTSGPDVNTGLPTANTQWSKDYVWRDGLLLAAVTPLTAGGITTRTQHFHLDHLGTPRLVTGDNGVQLGIHAYYAFGAELSLGLNEQPTELMKFTGHERDVVAGDPHTLDDMHARYYSASVGRFLSVDPKLDLKTAITNPQVWNRYSYAMNNPLRFTDPDGRCPVSIALGAGLTICYSYDLINMATGNHLPSGAPRFDGDAYTKAEFESGSPFGYGLEEDYGAEMTIMAPVTGMIMRGAPTALSMGRKMDFLFDKNIDQSIAHNAERAAGNAAAMRNAGIADTAANRTVVARYIGRALNDKTSIIARNGSRVTREIFIMGTNGRGVLIQFIEEKGKVISLIAKSGK